MNHRNRRGATLLEGVLFVPILILLLMGMIELGRVSYTFFTLQKVLYTAARYVGTQQGVNFCDESDPAIVAARNYALTGTLDSSAEPVLQGLRADQIRIRIERMNSDGGQLEQCECSAEGCDASVGGRGPDYLVVWLEGGYSLRLMIPLLPTDPIVLRPTIRVPFGGT